MNRTSRAISTDPISMMRTHSTLGSAADPAMPTRTQGHVKYSGKAVHGLGQNEGLSPPVMVQIKSGRVVHSGTR